MVSEPTSAAACAPLLNGRICTVITPLSPLTPARRPSWPSITVRSADLLAQCRLPDDHEDVGLALAKNLLLAGQRRLDDPVPRVVVCQGRISFGQRPCVVHGLQQRGYPLGLIDQDSRGTRLEEEVVLPGTGQNIGVCPVPSADAARIGHGGQDGLLLVVDAVLGEQLPQFLAADAALPGLDPADLRSVAFQDPGRVVKRVAQVLSVPAECPAYEPSAYWRCCDHD